MVSEQVFNRHRGGNRVLSHGYSLCASEIILGDRGTCQFVVRAHEVGGRGREIRFYHGFYPPPVAVVEERHFMVQPSNQAGQSLVQPGMRCFETCPLK